MDDTFRKRLKRLRLEAGKTQDDIAKVLNIKRSTYGEYERGKIIPPVEKIEQIAEILGVKPHYLIGWDTPDVKENAGESELSAKIKQLREERHKTLEEMAHEIGISVSTLSQYENGFLKIPYTAMKKIASYFGVDTKILYEVEFATGGNEKENIRESIRRLKLAEEWGRVLGKVIFTDDEHEELMNYAKYLIYKRNK